MKVEKTINPVEWLELKQSIMQYEIIDLQDLQNYNCRI